MDKEEEIVLEYNFSEEQFETLFTLVGIYSPNKTSEMKIVDKLLKIIKSFGEETKREDCKECGAKKGGVWEFESGTIKFDKSLRKILRKIIKDAITTRRLTGFGVEKIIDIWEKVDI